MHPAAAACMAICAVMLLSTIPGHALAQRHGVVYVDDNGNGRRDAGELGREGVALSNGRDVVLTGSGGSYELPALPGGDGRARFVSLSCPADARCPTRFHRLEGDDSGSRDFALLPAEREDDLFFVHWSDVHAYPVPEDLARAFNADSLPWWLPNFVIGWGFLNLLDEMNPQHSADEIVEVLRAAVAPHRDVDDAWGPTVVMAYFDAALDASTGLIDPGGEIPAAMAEVAALRPAFVISTGDMILEGNRGDADSVERWSGYYREVSGATGLQVWNTIGNNELGGTENPDFGPADSRYGKALFRGSFGPTRYSFDRGAFHFAAVDTHVPEFDLALARAEGFGGPSNLKEEWDFGRMEPEVREWLDADLPAARGRRLVVLNHEPFHVDPAWEFDDDEAKADDEGLYEKHGVAYSLAGHVHRNGFEDKSDSATTHITTGALSGFRWALPAAIDSRGYRLFYARGDRLYSAWKLTGKPLLGFVAPRGAPSIHPGSKNAPDPAALAGAVDVVVVAADVDQPFRGLTLELDGKSVAPERWGDYFARGRIDASVLAAGGSRLVLRASPAEGAARKVELEVARVANAQVQ